MDGADQLDDLTFRVNFGGDGVAKLRDRVKDKLKEFMGDYTDDTLVEYVIVLLKNGRRKVEAKNELNVFLGDDSDSFVSWLWDHLGSNLDLYVQPGESCSEEAVKTTPMPEEHAVKEDSDHLDSEAERERSNKVSRSRHSREWKGLVRNTDEPPPVRSVVTANVDIEDHKVGRSKQSSRQVTQRKRSRPDERHQVKRDIGSKTKINAPRRLLQFAVRDAVGTSRPSSISTTEPSLKRLRSVVSASTSDAPLEDPTARIRSVARMPNTFAVAIKAVADAAKDVVRLQSPGNVFDRLGRGTENVARTGDRIPESLEASIEDGNCGQIQEETRDYMLESDDEGFDDVNIRNRRATNASPIGISNKGDDSVMLQYSVADEADKVTSKPWKDEDRSAAVASGTSSKIVNTSVNGNTWKPPSHYEEPKEGLNMERRNFLQESEVGAEKLGVRIMKENSNPVTVDNGKALSAVDTQKEPQKTLPAIPGLYSTGVLTEDADSRTIFVSNVHFAATKDSLSRHFNKFGDVLKVIIVTDAATGQLKGSAYVEFMRKEAAEHALSLDGTSFMSRILKVVRKSAVHQEAAPMMTWPRVARGFPFAASRFARVPFPRGVPSIYRPRLPMKAGARSMQWKRDAQPTPSDGSNTVLSPTTRSLTYVRTEPKTENGN